MAPKRPIDEAGSAPDAKKPRKGFRVGPDNLPDGPWRRKVTKIKKDLIHKAKVKKQYAKVKAQEEAQKKIVTQPEQGGEGEEKEHMGDGETLHPTRQLMLKDEEAAQTGASHGGGDDEDEGDDPSRPSGSDGHRRRTRRPGYYDKQLKKAEERRLEAEKRAEEARRRREERERRIAERERYRRAMAKTRGPDGKKKLGRESTILLDKVKKMVAEQ